MPVEVKELVIRASIEDRTEKDRKGPDLEALKQDVLSKCADMIKYALENQTRR